MNDLETLLSRVSAMFQRRGQAWALVGGMAVSVRSEPRFTRDVDIAVSVPDDVSSETLVRDLQTEGFRAHTLVEQDAKGRLATVRLMPPRPTTPGMMLDLLFASSGIEREICDAAERLEVFPGLFVPVARAYHLMVLKALARDDRTRPQDATDLRQLVLMANEGDLSLALAAASLVQERGFNRERNLVEALTAFWGENRRL